MTAGKGQQGSDGFYYLLAVAVGALSGLVGTLFHLIVEWLFRLHTSLRGNLDGFLLQAVVFIAISMAAVAFSLFLVRRFAPEAAGSGVQEIEGALEDVRPLRWYRVLPVKFFGGLAALSSGLVLGREGPTIHMGASLGQATALTFSLEQTDRKGLLAAGAAAGLAAAFNAPLAAVLFVIEETRRQFPYTYRTYAAVIIASAMSAFVTEAIAGVGPDLAVPGRGPAPLWHYPLFLLLGVFLGAVGVVFNKVLIFSMDSAARVAKISPYLYPLSFAAIVGVLLVLMPEATGGGDGLVLTMLTGSESYSLGFLVLLLLIRSATTFGSYASGVPGGIFAPMLAMATCAGLTFGTAVLMIVPGPPDEAIGMAIAAMGGLFAATVRAPIVGIVLVMELTGAYDLMLPTIITCLAATLTAHRLKGEPIYELLLERTLRLANVRHGEQPKADEEPAPVTLGSVEEKKGDKGKE